MRIRLISVMIGICALLFLFVSGCAQQNGNNTQPAGTETAVTEGTQAPVCVHNWQDATCTTAKTCTICGATEGSLAAHDYSAWVPNGEGMHIRICKWDETHTEQAPCFNGNTPIEGDVCADCGYIYDPSHVHVYDQQIDTPNYKASGATCSVQAGYYYSCSCGMAGTDIFHSGELLAHTEVIDAGKHATYSVPGLTDGTHCSVCGTVVKAQTEIPALGSDIVAGTDYYDKVGQVTYRYSYSFTVYDNDRFNLTTLKVGSDDSYKLSGEDGTFKYLEHGVYELVFDSGRERMYGKIENGKFEFCNKDGSKWHGKDERPQGSTVVSITPRPGNSVYGYNDLAHNTYGKAMQELYFRLYAACEAFAESDKNVEPVNGEYVIDRINLDYYVLTADDVVKVIKIFLTENPRYYWLSNEFAVFGGKMDLCIDPAYADAAYRRSCDQAIDAMAQECAAKLTPDMDDLKKALTIHNFIIDRMNYAYKADGVTPQDAIWAHNMIGCAEKRSGVCESYAEVFQYLCLLNDLDCMIVTGYNGDNHAWNIMKLDGKWYGIDCTFDDTGTSAVSYNCFGMPQSRMENEYTADKPTNSGIQYLYSLPQLAKQGIELVDVYKANVYVGTYPNIDAAFAAMTDTNGEYELALYCYDVRGPLLLAAATVEHHITAQNAPNVKYLTIRGNNINLENGYYTRNTVYIDSNLKLNSDLTIYDLNLLGNGSLDIQNNKVICLGECVQFCIPVSGSMDPGNPSEIEDNTQQVFYSVFSMKVHTFRKVSMISRTEISRDFHFVELYADQIYIVGDNQKESRGQIDCFYSVGNRAGISVSHYANLVIGRVELNDLVNSVGIGIQFTKAEDFSRVSVGQVNGTLSLFLSGFNGGFVTDPNGNDMGYFEYYTDVSVIQGPVLTLTEPEMYANMMIHTANEANPWIDITHNYTMNEHNQIVKIG